MYEAIKERLIKQFTETDNKKLASLLNGITLGDMRPTDLLRKMRELSCNKVGDELLKTLQLQRLPITIQTVLSTSTEEINQLALLVDTMLDLTTAPTIQAVSQSQNNNFNDLVNVVCELEGKIENLRKVFNVMPIVIVVTLDVFQLLIDLIVCELYDCRDSEYASRCNISKARTRCSVLIFRFVVVTSR